MTEPGREAADREHEAAEAAGAGRLLGVGDLEQAAANYESAIRTYRQALDEATTPLERALALKGAGSSLERIGRWKEALGTLQQAADAATEAEDEGELGRILVKIGKIHLGQGAIDLAKRCGHEALERIDASNDPSSRGFALNLLGASYSRNGEMDQSARYIEEALSCFKKAGDIRSLSLAYNNLGLIYKHKCDWIRALEYLQVASSLQAIEGDYPERRDGLKNLGIVHFKMGQWDKARECFAQSIELSRKVNDPLGVIRALLGTAGVQLVRREWDAAIESLEQAMELSSEEQYPRETALTYQDLAQLHQARGDLVRARRCLEVAWRKAVEISQEGDLIAELLRLRAELALEEGRLVDAESLCRRAVELSAKLEDRMEHGMAQVALGRVLRARGDETGYALLESGRELLRRLGNRYPLTKALIHEGRLLLAAGADLPKAEAVLLDAREAAAVLDLPQIQIEIHTLLAEVSGRRGELDRAGEYLERARGLVSGTKDAAVVEMLADAQRALEGRLVETSVVNLGAFRTAGRLEEIVDSRRPYVEKLDQVLAITAQAVDADGAAFVFTSEDLQGSTHRIGSAGARQLETALRAACPERPEIILDATTSVRESWRELAETRQASSFLIIPISGNGTTAYLYLDRLGERRRSAFGPSHLNLCLALVPQFEALVQRAPIETPDANEEDTLRRRTFLADVVTQNPEMVEILKLVEKVNRTDLTVLLQGETGTGKTLIAKAIHLSSDRAAGPFVTVDCAALPENLLESELFGYVKGAFTGAAQDKKGLFEEADGGTVFLDEIGKAGLGVQRRLLHLLDRGEVRPVGSTSYRKLNVRVICATSKTDLFLDDGSGPFIKDLYYRLNDIIIRVPSLRERPEDIPLLSEYFLEQIKALTNRDVPGFTRSALQRLVRYTWPGNVRELEKVVRRAAILADDGASIGVDLLPREVLEATENPLAASPGRDGDLRNTVEEMERRLVLDALTKHQWNKTRAAEELGLSRKGLKNKIVRYDLSRS